MAKKTTAKNKKYETLYITRGVIEARIKKAEVDAAAYKKAAARLMREDRFDEARRHMKCSEEHALEAYILKDMLQYDLKSAEAHFTSQD